MMPRNSDTHYGPLARLLHWGMALLVIIALIAVEVHDWFPKGGNLRNAMMSTHFQFGLLVFLLIWVRLGVVFSDKVSSITPPPPRWQELAAKLVHLALYVSMIVLPVLGVLVQQSGNHAVALLGMQLPTFIGVDKDFSKELKEVHATIGNVLIGLVVVHAAAAFWHHFKQHDDTMLRMLPPRKG
jgi:superoxide oxidase